MKKIMLISALILTAALAGCGNKDNGVANVDPAAKIPNEILDQVTGENQTVETVDVTTGEISSEIKEVNRDAVVKESFNPGMKMLQIELPLIGDKAIKFFKQVEEIVDECDFDENNYYDYFYFSSSENGNVQLAASFEFDENRKLVLDAVTGIGEEYQNAAEVAATVSPLFKQK